MDCNDILILCCHVKRSLFFEDSMKRLWNNGFKRIWIQQTGTDNFGPYSGPNEYYFRASHIPALWDQHCLVGFHNKTKKEQTNFKYIFLVDFDLFMSGTKEFKECLEEISKGEYDHVSRFKIPSNQNNYDFKDGVIATVSNIQIKPGNTEHDWPELNPHFATGFEFFSKRLWDSFTTYELGDGRRMYRAAIQKGFKMGAHKTNFGVEERFWNNELFHVSNLTYYYNKIGTGDVSSLKTDNKLDVFKMGYFAAQERYYGNVYPQNIARTLEQAYQQLGGKQRCLDEWDKEVAHTCMKGWTKYD